METWIRNTEESSWRPFADTFLALSHLCRTKVHSVLLVSDRPVVELESLRAAVGIVRKLTDGAVQVIVASPHPSDEWMTPLKESGADHFWMISRRVDCGKSRLDQAQDLDSSTDVCPALHVRVGLSVCGWRHDRMVLARHHLMRWCLGRQRDCPHWPGDR